MPVFKSIADIIEVAIRIERQGIEFYIKLHDQAAGQRRILRPGGRGGDACRDLPEDTDRRSRLYAPL
jgi:hypothetical protein